MEIPKIVHWIWFDFGKGQPEIPTKFHAGMKRTRELNPDFEFKIWSEKSCHEFMKDKFPTFYNFWATYKKKIYQVDSIRIFLLLYFGGIYVDLDIDHFLPFSRLLSDNATRKCLFIKSSHSNVISNFIMASSSQHPLFLFLVNQLPIVREKNKFIHRSVTNYQSVFILCGPNFINKYVLEFQAKYPELKEEIYALPTSSYSKEHATKLGVTNYGNHNFAFGWNLGTEIMLDIVVGISIAFILACVIAVIVLATKKDLQKKNLHLKTTTVQSVK